MWPHVTFIFKIVHRGRADRTLNHLALIEHRKLNDHPIEVEALHITSPQRHCDFSTLKEFHLPDRLTSLDFLAEVNFYKSRGPRRTSITRLAAATISSVLLFSRLIGLFGHGEVEPGEKIDALHPFPTGQTSILYPLYSIIVIVYRHCSRLRGWFATLAICDDPRPLCLSILQPTGR
jgi:hypothetical protein